MPLGGVANESAIVDFFPFLLVCRLTGNDALFLFYSDRVIYWACAGKYTAFIVYGSFLYIMLRQISVLTSNYDCGV